MKFAVIVFPGSNCDHDAQYAVEHVLGQDAQLVWHKDTSLGGADVVILPGGFAHGDYLRTGAIARFSPIMHEVKKFAAAGGPLLGICNGFQVLLEAGLLPGAMLRNGSLQFRCEHVHVRVEHTTLRSRSNADRPTSSAFRSLMGKAIISLRQGHRAARKESTNRLPVRRSSGGHHRRGESEWLGQQHRWNLQRSP